MNLLYALLSILFVNTVIGITFFFRNKRKNWSLIFGFFFLNVTIWIASLIAIPIMGPVFWNETAFISAQFILLSFLLFAHLMPTASKKRKWYHFWYVIPTIVLNVLIAININWLISSTTAVNNSLISELGPLYPIHQAYIGIYSLAAIILLLFNIRREKNIIIKTQMKYVAFGVILFIVGAITTNMILPSLGIFNFNLLSPLLTIPMVISISYAITHYRFLDLHLVFRKSMTYVTTALLAGGLFLILIKENSPFSYVTNKLMASIIFIFAVLYFDHIFQFVQKIYNHLSPASRKYIEILKGLNEKVVNTLNLKDLTDSLIQKLPIALAVSNQGTLYLKNNSDDFIDVQKNSLLKTKTPLSDYFQCHNHGITLDEVEVEWRTNPVFKQKYKGLKQSFKELTASLVLPLKKGNELIGLYVLKKAKSDNRISELLSSNRLKEVEKFLNQKVAIALSNAQKYQRLRDLQKKADATEKELIQSLYHEFNTPLTVIKGNLELMKAHNGQHHKKEIANAENSIDRVSHTTNRLIEIMHLGKTGVCTPKCKPLHLHALVSRLLKSVERKPTIKIIHQSSTHHILGAPEWTKKMIEEVLKNAFFYAKSLVKIHYKKGGNMLYISIYDDGKEIPKKHLDRVFDKFYRADLSRTKSTGGAGLGLALAKAIAKKQGGNISITCASKKGTTVTIGLPCQNHILPCKSPSRP